MPEIDEKEQFYRDTETVAHPRLKDQQLAMLEQVGTRRVVRRGELVIKAGQRNLGLTAGCPGGHGVVRPPDPQTAVLPNPRPPAIFPGTSLPTRPAPRPHPPRTPAGSATP